MNAEIDYSLKTCEADKTFSIRMPGWLKAQLEAIARSKGISASAVALNLLKHGIMERVCK